MKVITLNIEDELPLTCSRSGTCCCGKLVLINTWELFQLAEEKKIMPREFRDKYCEFGGIRIRFDGKKGWKGQNTCSQYVDNFGCSVHIGRPLACRLYPLGRQIQSEVVSYIYQGDEFPCLDGCPEVIELPYLNIAKYLEGQLTSEFEKAQDAYLELMQKIADIAFELLLDTGLAESGDKETLAMWRIMGNELPDKLAERIGEEWMDYLMLPEISDEIKNPILFACRHYDLIQNKVQEKFGAIQTNKELHEASVLIMGVALLLACGIGANSKDMAEYWIDIAKNHGALE